MSQELRILPHSPDSERALIGSILVNPVEALPKVLELGVTFESFFDRRNQVIFEHLAEFDEKHLDLITLSEALKSADAIDKAGGYDYLQELLNLDGVFGHIEQYAGTVQEAHRARLGIEVYSDSCEALFRGDRADAVGSLAISELESIVPVSHSTLKTDIEQARAEFDMIAEGKMMCLPFPYRQFHMRTMGIPLRAVTPVLGRDKKGKSRLFCLHALFWAMEGIPTLVFAFEDGKNRYLQNMAATLGGYDAFGVRRNPSPVYTQNAHRCMERLNQYPLRVTDDPHTVETALIEVSKFSREHGGQPIAVLFDGFKDFIESGGKENRTQSENHMFETLKKGAVKLNAGIVCIEHPHDVKQGDWLDKRNIKGSKQRYQSARFMLIFQDAGFPEEIKDKYGIYDETNYVVLQCAAASYGEEGYVVLKPNLCAGTFDEIRQEDEI